jgi:hypothetical protein
MRPRPDSDHDPGDIHFKDDQVANYFLRFRRMQIALDIPLFLWVQQTHISDVVLTSTFNKCAVLTKI